MIGYPGPLANEMAGAFAEMLRDDMGDKEAVEVMAKVEEQDWFWARVNDILDEIKEVKDAGG
jgi:hypothetical protein